jgi:hypothetical protein
MNDINQFYDWLAIGIDKKWVSDVACLTHNGLENTEEEEKEWDEGGDPCQHAVRVWVDNIED